MMRVLIVDDEQLARDRLRLLLGAFDDVQIVGEAEDGEQAMERVGELQPDLVVLDIQMPGCSGIEVASSLPSPRPKIIFCTAFDQYAVDAFEISAIDYLLKPVNRARLTHAIERARTLSVGELDANMDRVTQNRRMARARFLGRRGPRFVVIPQKDVVYWSSDGGLTKLHSASQSYLMEPTLIELETPSRSRRILPHFPHRDRQPRLRVGSKYVGGRIWGGIAQDRHAPGSEPQEGEDLDGEAGGHLIAAAVCVPEARQLVKCPSDFVSARPDMSGHYIAAIVGARHASPDACACEVTATVHKFICHASVSHAALCPAA